MGLSLIRPINNTMPTYIGFSTIGQYKKFTLTDFALVKRDFLNSLNIRYGEKVGRPGYGTKIWSFIFEQQDDETYLAVKKELQRMVDLDPRIYALRIDTSPNDVGLIVDMEVQLAMTGSVSGLRILFDEQSAKAIFV
jgi:phage baseplate assembly protein W